MPEKPEKATETTTRCCIVGGGPAGAMLGLLLARAGIPCVLLEGHDDFDREFRGDTLHPSAMEILDDLGLAGEVLDLPHEKVPQFAFATDRGTIEVGDFRRLHTRFPYIALVHQPLLLNLLTTEAARTGCLTLVMGAHVRELIVEDGIVRGVRYRSREGWAEVRALLTVAADGRSSTVRRLIGMEPVRTSPPMDVLWFRLPRFPGDTLGSGGQAARGRFIVRLRREDHWQIGYLFTKGSYQRLRAQGIEALRAAVTEAAPEFADRVDAVRDWKDVSLLSVESSRLRRWYAPGLLLIGDAAHVMSPVAGVGINYALQDAVAAADLLEAPLRAGRLSLRDLAAVQRRRELPTRVIQAFQRLIQRGLVAPMIAGRTPRTLPLVLGVVTRVPLLRQLPLRLIGYGLRPSLLPERFAVHRAPTPA